MPCYAEIFHVLAGILIIAGLCYAVLVLFRIFKLLGVAQRVLEQEVEPLLKQSKEVAENINLVTGVVRGRVEDIDALIQRVTGVVTRFKQINFLYNIFKRFTGR